MQETTKLQTNDGNKVTTTFKCSPATRAQLLTKAAQLDITLFALCEDYIIAGLSAINKPEQPAAPPAEKPERTLTDTDLKLIHSEVEQAILNYEASAQDDDEADEEAPQPATGTPVLALSLTPAQRQVIDQVNEFRKSKNIPALEDSAAEVLTGYAQTKHNNFEFKEAHGLSMTAFKKALNAQDEKTA